MRGTSRAAAIVLGVLFPALAYGGVEQNQLEKVTALTRIALGKPANPPSRLSCCQPAGTCMELAEPDAPPPAAQLTSGSPNQKLLARVWNYGYALRHRDTQNVSAARALLLEIFNKQDDPANPGYAGHYALSTANGGADEALTVSHYHLWAAGVMGAYAIALANGDTYTSALDPRVVGDAPVRDAARRWWLLEKRLYDLLSNDGAEAAIPSPGARFNPSNPVAISNRVRDANYRLLRRLSVSKSTCWWENEVELSAWVMRELGTRVSVLAVPDGAPPPLRLHNTLCLYRNGGDYAISFPRLEWVTDPLFWIARIGGALSRAPLGYGVKPLGPSDPPFLPGESVTAVAGVSRPAGMPLPSQADAQLECETAPRQ